MWARILLKNILTDKDCADYIKNGWNALYNDLIECAKNGTLENLNEISSLALDDYYDNKYENAFL